MHALTICNINSTVIPIKILQHRAVLMLLLHMVLKTLLKPTNKGKVKLKHLDSTRANLGCLIQINLKFFKGYSSHLSNECSDTSCGITS